jgi:hypothetical protein
MSVYSDGDRNNSLIRGFVGSIDLAGHRGCCIHDGGVVFVWCQWCGALIEQGPPWSFLQVSSRYAHGVDFQFMLLPLPLSFVLT